MSFHSQTISTHSMPHGNPSQPNHKNKTSTMMPRISQMKMPFAVLLLSLMLVEINAFVPTPNIKLPSTGSRAPSIVIRRFGSEQERGSIGNLNFGSESDPPAEYLITTESKNFERRDGKIAFTFVVFCFLSAFSNLQSVSNLGPEALTSSTVSASLLRSNQNPRWGSSLQNIVLTSMIGWQMISQGGNAFRMLASNLASFSAWYIGCLSNYPLFTKALTTAMIGLLGDTAAQFTEERIRSKKERTSIQFRKRYDRRRGLANVAFGIFVNGPLLHFAYNLLENLIPVSGATTGFRASIAALTQVLIDDVVIDSVFVAIMFFTTGLGEGYKPKQILSQLRKDYTGAVKTSWATSILVLPFEFILFRWLPLSLRVLGMNLIDIVWEGMVSFMLHRRRRGVIDDGEEMNANTMGLCNPVAIQLVHQ